MHSAFVNYGSMSVKELPLHRNLGMEIVYVSEGRLRWVVESRIETLCPGTVFFTLPWQAHGSNAVHEPGNRVHFIQIRLDRIYREAARSFRFHPGLDIPARDAQRLSRVFAGTSRHAWWASEDLTVLLPALVKNLDREADPLLIQGYARSILAELAGIISGDISADIQRPATEQRVVQFLQTLRRRCDEPWSLPEMADACHMGRSHFADIIHRLTGDTPMAHLCRLRVERAEQRLRTTDDSITDIALETGFSTTQLFARTFKKFTNRTPTQFRQQVRQPSSSHVIDFTEADEEDRRVLVQRHDWL